MRQATLKLKMYAENVNVINHNLEKFILRGMLWFMAGLMILYVVFLGNMVFNIVARRALETEARTLSSEVGDLELTYLSMSNKVDLNLASSLGYQEVKPIIYATRTSVGLAPKKNSNEI